MELAEVFRSFTEGNVATTTMVDEMKVCGTCKVEKPLTAFHQGKGQSYFFQCRSCNEAQLARARAVLKQRAATKTCTACRQAKPLEVFARDASAKDKHKAKCRECSAEYMKAWRAKRKGDAAAAVAVNDVVSDAFEDTCLRLLAVADNDAEELREQLAHVEEKRAAVQRTLDLWRQNRQRGVCS